MRVLLLGGGGREHAIGWSLAEDIAELVTAPGNPGLAGLGPTLPGLDVTDPGAVTAAADGFDLVVVGPEAPLAAGVADAVTAAGVPVFGPRRAAARLETSKAFAKEIMQAAGVPTAAAKVFTHEQPALDHLATVAPPYVVKADGLAAGKGVLVTEDPSAAAAWVHRCFGGGFGAAGARVVIEDFLDGPEVSVFAVCDGTTVVPLAPARDYKRLADGDAGPNTGGMGAYSPVPSLPPGLVSRVVDDVMRPVLAELADRGHPYRGFLYAGMVLTGAGPQVLEFNCRLGDPETQVVLPRLAEPLAPLLLAAANGDLEERPLAWHDGAAVNVVMASAGYPESPVAGEVIDGVKVAADLPDVLVFHAGTARRDGELVTSGGRVLSVVGTGPDLEAARHRAYAGVAAIEFAGANYRKDIGQ